MAKRPNIKQKRYCNKFNEDFKNGSHNNNNNKNLKKKLIRQPQREPSHVWRLGTLEQQVRSLSSRGLQGRGGNTKEKAQWAQICGYRKVGGSRGWLVLTGKKKKKNFPKKVPATETLKREKGDGQVRGLFSATWTRVQTPGRAKRLEW